MSANGYSDPGRWPNRCPGPRIGTVTIGSDMESAEPNLAQRYWAVCRQESSMPFVCLTTTIARLSFCKCVYRCPTLCLPITMVSPLCSITHPCIAVRPVHLVKCFVYNILRGYRYVPHLAAVVLASQPCLVVYIPHLHGVQSWASMFS